MLRAAVQRAAVAVSRLSPTRRGISATTTLTVAVTSGRSTGLATGQPRVDEGDAARRATGDNPRTRDAHRVVVGVGCTAHTLTQLPRPRRLRPPQRKGPTCRRVSPSLMAQAIGVVAGKPFPIPCARATV